MKIGISLPSEQHCSPASGLKQELPAQTMLPAPKQLAQLRPVHESKLCLASSKDSFGVTPTFFHSLAATREEVAAKQTTTEVEKRIVKICGARTRWISNVNEEA